MLDGWDSVDGIDGFVLCYWFVYGVVFGVMVGMVYYLVCRFDVVVRLLDGVVFKEVLLNVWRLIEFGLFW